MALFTWLNPILSIANKTPFQQSYHYDLHEDYKSDNVYTLIRAEWLKRKPQGASAEAGARINSVPLIKTVVQVFRSSFIIYAFMSIVISLAEYMNAYIMQQALKAIKNQSSDITFEDKVQGVGKLIFALIASKLLLTVVN